jgi:DNA-3-methyladenine glycosylase II
VDLAAALRDVSGRDPVLRALVAELPPPAFGAGGRRLSHFAYLARAVTHQHVSTRSAEAVWRRVRATVDGPFRPADVAALGTGRLRAAGLTAGKARAVADLAERVADGRLSLAALARRPDEEVVEALSEVWGIGRWTAEMFLLLHLGRPDVWPVGDLAVRRGYARAWSLAAPPTAGELERLGERFRPHRSIVAWYCWRASTPGTV